MKSDEGSIPYQDTQKILRQRVCFELYVDDDTKLTRWLSGLDIVGDSTVEVLARGSRKKRSSSASIEDAMAEEYGLSLETDAKHEDTHFVYHVVVSQVHLWGARRVFVTFDGRPEADPLERLRFSSDAFDQAIVDLAPAYGYLQAGNGAEHVYDTRYMPETPMPVVSYWWRNYLTPRAVGDICLGDGSVLREPCLVDFGVMPFVPLAERDRVQAQLAPLLSRRRPLRVNTLRSPYVLNSASVDGGIEIPDSVVADLGELGYEGF